MARVGVFGGTFDPIHNGHLVVATTVHHALALDETRVVVAGDPWQKQSPPIASATERFAAVQAAVADIEVPAIRADDSEVARDGPTYTVDTIEAFRAARPDDEFFLTVGFDATRFLSTWHRVDTLRDLVTLVVVNRPGVEPVADLAGWKIETVHSPSIDVSSTMVRARLRTGFPVDGLVPAAAMRVVRNHNRYA